MPEDTALPESKLGTKEHWDSVYEREVKNFEEIGDEGEVWFGEDAVHRMASYVARLLEDGEVAGKEAAELRILDLGTGNGHLLFALLDYDEEHQLQPRNLLGVDYSKASIDLARSVLQKRAKETDSEHDFTQVQFEEADLLDGREVERIRGGAGFGLVCDKGTLDAIALSSQPIGGRLPVDLYTTAVKELTSQDGLFLITSCNFTEQELIARFTAKGAGFAVEKVLPTPQFQFGGVSGSTTTTICFRRTG